MINTNYIMLCAKLKHILIRNISKILKLNLNPFRFIKIQSDDEARTNQLWGL